MLNGGSVTLIYGFIVCWIGTLATASSLAELSSMSVIANTPLLWREVLQLLTKSELRFLEGSTTGLPC